MTDVEIAKNFSGHVEYTGEKAVDLLCNENPPRDTDKAQEIKRASAANCRFIRLRNFVFVSGLLMCAQSALTIYTKSVLTSIEMRFQISSSLAGVIVGSFNFGNMMFVVLVSKLSSNSHRPRIMALGSMLVAFGGFFNVIPHLASSPYDPLVTSDLSRDPLLNSTGDGGETGLKLDDCASSNHVLLIIGEMLQGIGATVLVPLGSSYIDDFAQTGNSPLYLGIMFLLQNLGPGIGYLVGSLTTRLYVDFDRVESDNIPISSSDPMWVGAWWLGYIIIGICVILSAIPLFWFPRRMEDGIKVGKKIIRGTKSPIFPRSVAGAKDNQLEGLDVTENIESKATHPMNSRSNAGKILEILRDLYATLRRLITDPVYMLIVMGYSSLMFLVAALTAFMPKFLEVVFFQSKPHASLTFGLSMPIVICIGLFSGGLIVQRLKWTVTDTMRFVCVVSAVTILLCIPTFYVTCNPEPSEACGKGIAHNSSNECAEEKGAMCRQKCYTFVAIMSLAALLCCHIVTPYYSIILRTVNPKDKCTAIGLKFLIIRMAAFIPSPMVTGAVIDDACLDWTRSGNCDGSSTCLRYDREKFRLSYLAIIFFGILFTFLFNTAAWIALRRKIRREKGKKPDSRKLTSLL